MEAFPDATIFRPSSMMGEEDKFLDYYSSVRRRFLRKHLAVWNKGKGTFKAPVHVSF